MKCVTILLLMALCAASARTTPGRQAPAKSAPPNQIEQNPAERNPAGQSREGAIAGRVIGPDGRPLANARVYAVRISDRLGSPRSAEVSDDGNFKLAGLKPGIYILGAQAPGFISAGTSGENAIHRIGENLTISLVKGGVITGRATDEAGEPIVGVGVHLHRLRDPEGRVTGPQFGAFGSGFGVTDDRGIYRAYGLPPGVYIASIDSDNSAQIIPDSPTYYPSATRETAAEINLRDGEEISGIDIRHRGDRGHVVSGSVSGEIESSYSSVSVRLEGLDAGSFEAMTSISNTRGFTFYNVPDGVYELITTRGGGADETSSSARLRISVKGADVSGVELKLAPSGSITGRIVIEPSSTPNKCAIKGDPVENQTSGQIQEQTGHQPNVEEILLIANRVSADQREQMSRFGRREGRASPPNEKSEFTLKNLEAGRYNIMADLPDSGWRIRAIIQAGQSGPGSSKPSTEAAGTAGTMRSPVDASRNGIAIKPGEKVSGVEVIVVDGAASLSGRVVPAKEGMKLPTWLHAHLVPAEAASADDVIRYAETKVGADGSFEFKHIAPGKYLLHARQVAEKEANDDQARPIAWDTVGRAKLRHEAAAAKNEIDLKVCDRVKEHVLRWQP